MGNSGAAPGQGSQATQEKWANLEIGLKKSALAGAGILGLSGLFAAADYLTGGQYQINRAQSIFAAGLTFVGLYLSALTAKEVMGEDMRQSISKGWEKIKRLTGGGDQGTKPK